MELADLLSTRSCECDMLFLEDGFLCLGVAVMDVEPEIGGLFTQSDDVRERAHYFFEAEGLEGGGEEFDDVF